jgi:hypothetical protein
MENFKRVTKVTFGGIFSRQKPLNLENLTRITEIEKLLESKNQNLVFRVLL